VSKLSDVGAERAVLAGIFRYGIDGYTEVSDIVSNSTFTIISNQIIYNCAEHAIKHNPKLDLPVFLSSAHALGVSDQFKDKTELEYLRSLNNYPIEMVNLRGQAKKIKKLEIARIYQDKLKQAHNDIGNINGTETIDEIVSKAEKPIFEFARQFNQGEDRPVLIGESIEEYVEYLTNNENRAVGIPSGFDKYDDAIGGGFRRKTVALIGARPKCGKSTLADNVAIHVSHRLKIPVLMIDTEMCVEDHQNRLLAYFSKIKINDIERGRFASKKYEVEKVRQSAKTIAKLPYTYKNVAGKDFDEILSIIRRWVYQEVGFDTNGRTNDCLIVYDYFKLMSQDALESMQEYQAIGFQVSELHNFCIENDVPVLAFVQLNRDGIDKDLTSSISQSDRLVWLCTNISIYKKKTEEEIAEDGEENGNRKLIPLEARHGGGMGEGNYINMLQRGEYAMITELRTKADIQLTGTASTGFPVEESGFESWNNGACLDGLSEDRTNQGTGDTGDMSNIEFPSN